MSTQTISEAIKAKRLALGWSQRQLSKAAGLNESAIKNIEAGKSRNPRGDTLSAIAAALGCSLSDFYNDTPGEDNVALGDTEGAPDPAPLPDINKLRTTIIVMERLAGLPQEAAQEKADRIIRLWLGLPLDGRVDTAENLSRKIS